MTHSLSVDLQIDIDPDLRGFREEVASHIRATLKPKHVNILALALGKFKSKCC